MGEVREEHKRLVRNLKTRDHSKDLGIDQMLILKLFLKKIGCEDVDWIHLDLDSSEKTLVNMILNFKIPENI
jgi:hypothetical protein